jgi:glycosyltransferase involved in cell wall biosynthesis
MLKVADQVSFICRSTAVDILGSRDAATAHVIYNAIPDLAPHDADCAPPPMDMLYVGTTSVRKRLHVLPFVLQAVREAVPGATMGLVGVDLDRDLDLRGLFSEFGLLDAVLPFGPVRSDQVGPFYRATKLLLIPSAYEGLPMVVLEALQSGIPCVATRVSGHPEVIEHGSNGFLVTCDDVEEMAARCVEILSSTRLQRTLGERGRKVIAQRFALPRQIQQYTDLYRKMITAR